MLGSTLFNAGSFSNSTEPKTISQHTDASVQSREQMLAFAIG